MAGQRRYPSPDSRLLLALVKVIAIIDLMWWLLEMSFVLGSFAVGIWQAAQDNPATNYPAPIISFTRFGFFCVLTPNSPLAWIGAVALCVVYLCFSAVLAIGPWALLMATKPTTPITDAIEVAGRWINFAGLCLALNIVAVIDPTWSNLPQELTWTFLTLHGIGIFLVILMRADLILEESGRQEEIV